ncbi:hypothetical protein [Agarivorans sp. Z349TD_8]|uniref:hypothetical protein n=1 Tax=Agarivorans sp. Z349TD_8 TaxID=3421434 RepID=UPI003D7DEAF5
MLKIRHLIAIALLSFSSTSIAESYSDPSVITALTFGTDGVRVRLESMKAAESCETQNYYFLHTPDESHDKLISVLLSAKVAQQKVSLQLAGCHQLGANNYPKISHIYFCDTSFCS